MEVGRDGRIHPIFTHNPSTLRLACQNPNAQNLPRQTGKQEDLCNYVRNTIVAGPGKVLIEYDFSAIEAVLVGYFARLPYYIRLAKLGVHSYLASHILKRPADLTWSDADLRAYFKEIKSSKDSEVIKVYNGAKRTVHLSGYGGTPRKMHEAEPEVFPTEKYAREVQAIYFNLFPEIRKWHWSMWLDAEKDGYLRNPFGYIHRFNKVFRYEKVSGKWEKKPDTGGDANAVLAFMPQSTAAGIIKEAMLRMWDRFDEVGQYLRLQVHDSLVAEVDIALADEVGSIMQTEMEKPVECLRLSESYGMGKFLSIDVEGKRGQQWGRCK